MSHTPGPWRVYDHAGDEYPFVIVMNDPADIHPEIAQVRGEDTTHDQAYADARLIAAAPEMLALLNAILEQDIPSSLHVQIDILLARIEDA